MHDAVRDYVRSAVDLYGLGGDVLDIGGRDVNGTVTDLIPADSYTVVDVEPAPNVDIVADAATLDLLDRYDVIICTEVLEHAEHAEQIVAAAHRHLRPHGAFVATMAGPGRGVHSAHGGPFLLDGEWYRNVEPDVLEHWLETAGFATFTIDQRGHDVRCTAFRGGD